MHSDANASKTYSSNISLLTYPFNINSLDRPTVYTFLLRIVSCIDVAYLDLYRRNLYFSSSTNYLRLQDVTAYDLGLSDFSPAIRQPSFIKV